ncbi:MAG: ribose 5-phosphate isomerase B [Desulfobacterales bacterium]|nr:ribose 5-phosphate isomerase B [Desulfobacterales bacterium]
MSENKTPIIIGSDHAGYPLKEKIKEHIIETGIEIEDAGTYAQDSVDYPDFGIKVAHAVSIGKFKRGILLCGTGIGMSMVSNRFPHVRAALCNDLFSTIMSRRHNNSNILVMGGRIIGEALAMEIVKLWLETPFDGERHQLRIEKFDGINNIGICGSSFKKTL